MPEESKKERFDSYEEYTYNKSVLREHVAVPTPELSNFPKNILSHEIQNRNDIKIICITLKNYLLHFTMGNSCDDNKCCGYFNFWLNKNAREDESINKTTFSHYKECINYYSNFIDRNKCISEIYYINDPEFEKKKRLYDLYDSYDDFNLITGDYSRGSFSNICTDKYNDLIGECTNVIDDDFCKELMNFWNNFLTNILTSKEHCEEKIVGLLSPEGAMVEPEEEEEEEKQELEPKQHEQQQQQPQEEGETQEVARELVRLGNVAGVETDLGAGEIGVMPSERLASGNFSGDRDLENFVEHHNFNTPKSMGTIIGTSFGFFIPLTMLYKFTPLGSWINTRVLGIDKLMDNMKKNEREFILNNAQSQEINSGDTIYRIKYNSALNE